MAPHVFQVSFHLPQSAACAARACSSRSTADTTRCISVRALSLSSSTTFWQDQPLLNTPLRGEQRREEQT